MFAQAETLRLNPRLYPSGFSQEVQAPHWKDSLTSRDYVQAVEVTDNRELWIVWSAISEKRYYVIDVPE
ncbi:hypothetical protein RRF57_006474 [Xylaria bambusicola]|uniref:Uncharacterized protein n=1 Tax=Xylaria bambusicola TaxID=326684 RepID=A0AAN7UNV3_9PEZI